MEFTTENYTIGFSVSVIYLKSKRLQQESFVCVEQIYTILQFFLSKIWVPLYFFYLKDYPSVGQILQKARENNINVIFVIGGANNKLVRSLYYDKLAALLPGGFNNASELTTDASNILDIVGNSYRVNHYQFSN